MELFILLIIGNLKTQVTKRTQIAVIFLNLDNLTDIKYKLFKFGVVILDTIPKGIVSQIFDLGPCSFFLSALEREEILQTFSRFWHKIKTKT